jgi:hypothetical protein
MVERRKASPSTLLGMTAVPIMSDSVYRHASVLTRRAAEGGKIGICLPPSRYGLNYVIKVLNDTIADRDFAVY